MILSLGALTLFGLLSVFFIFHEASGQKYDSLTRLRLDEKNNLSALPPLLTLIPIGNSSVAEIPLRAGIIKGEESYQRNYIHTEPFELNNWHPSIKFQTKERTLNSTNEIKDLFIDYLLIGQITSFGSFEDLLKNATLFRKIPLGEKVVLMLPTKGPSFMAAQLQFTAGRSGIYFGVFDANQVGPKPSSIDLVSGNGRNNKQPKVISPLPGQAVLSQLGFSSVASSIICGAFANYGYELCHLHKSPDQRKQSDESWSTGVDMPAPRSEITAAILNNKIYVIGGADYSSAPQTTNTVEAYATQTYNWSTAAPLPRPLDHAAAAAYDGKIYLVGGFLEGKTPTNSLLIYDSANNRWEVGKPMPTPRAALTANFINGTLYAIGGVNSSYTSLDINEAYDPKTNTWTEKAQMPTARNHLTSAVANGKLYVFGGRTLTHFSNPTLNEHLTALDYNEIYDPKKDSWLKAEPMQTKRSGFAAASINGSIYVFGGQGIDKNFDSAEKYDVKSNKWTALSPMPTARHGLAAVSNGDIIYVIGGHQSSPSGLKRTLSVNEILHLENRTR